MGSKGEGGGGGGHRWESKPPNLRGPYLHRFIALRSFTPERSRQGVGTGHESSNFAASHYLT